MLREHDSIIWTPSPEEIEKERDWINEQIQRIGLHTLEELANDASVARKRAFAPQSGYLVGAAIIRKSSKRHSGQNIEIFTYSETGHAEEQAIKDAVSEGAVDEEGKEFINAVAVSHEGDTAPCGRCRNIIAQFSNNCLVIVADTEGRVRNITSSKILLPYAFTPSNLEKE
jgi:cytidine deaminase